MRESVPEKYLTFQTQYLLFVYDRQILILLDNMRSHLNESLLAYTQRIQHRTDRRRETVWVPKHIEKLTFESMLANKHSILKLFVKFRLSVRIKEANHKKQFPEQ